MDARKTVFIAELTKWDTVDVRYPEQRSLFSVINVEPLATCCAPKSIAAIARPLFNCFSAATTRTVFFLPY